MTHRRDKHAPERNTGFDAMTVRIFVPKAEGLIPMRFQATKNGGHGGPPIPLIVGVGPASLPVHPVLYR